MCYFYILIILSCNVFRQLIFLKFSRNLYGTVHRLKLDLFRASVFLRLIIIERHIIKKRVLIGIHRFIRLCIGILIQRIHVSIIIIRS